MFEQKIDDAADQTGWDVNSKYTLVLEFLENHCKDKIDLFNKVIDQIVVDELLEV